MRFRSILAACGAALSLTAAAPEAPPNRLTSSERAAGWTLLFNGRDLSGWGSFAGGPPPAGWRVRDGTIELVRDDGQMTGTDLVTDKSFGAFELTLDWKVAAGGNSGILYLARNQAPARQVYETGLEMQVLDNTGHSDGRIPSHRAGALYDMTVPPPSATRPAGQWNHARLLVERGRIRQWLNGVPTADVSYGDAGWRKRVAASKFAKMPLFGTFDSGVVALQDHGEPVAFRNLKLRPIGPSAVAGSR
ncbi:hypothetical protein COC42_08025 [Sphingomonas spermidinifaciens]|uniref:3-keto-alpha-glucoside-1,2-lyase/3-keto-2-hydroxy-glucal hydratase domain-containing protein n=1 Tax=Sphingomonas spermidinifaciens TaxID=1141889 RepID=A0A2A4B9C1_9SPHN|nr:DUF1080 domain-containing protein [Sphingomonas spermidinifaciens]PCD04224.1 hypothetical protein COC42_08025 [Sphingomonas spermidinifaciens]